MNRPDNDNRPRLMGRKAAAEYLDIGESTFSLWVKNHKMPKPVPGTRKWDRRAIDSRLDELGGMAVNDNKQETGLQKWRKTRDARRAQGTG